MLPLLLGAASLAAANTPAPTPVQPATSQVAETTPVASAVVGVWRLVAVKFAGEAGQASRGDGFGTDGLIIYTPSGYMTAHIVLPASRTAASATATPSHHAYFGTYSVNTVTKTIVHHRFANDNPGLPIEVVRGYRFLGNGHLVLTPNGPGDQLTFERVGN